MPWSIEYVAKRDQGNPILLIKNHSLKWMCNYNRKKWDYIPHWMKFRRLSTKQQQQYYRVPKNYIVGIYSKRRARDHSMRWLHRIRKLSRLSYCWRAQSRVPGTKSLISYPHSKNSVGCGVKTSLTASRVSVRRIQHSKIMRINWRSSHILRKKLRRLNHHIRLEPWNSKPAVSVWAWRTMLKTGRTNTHKIYIKEPDHY